MVIQQVSFSVIIPTRNRGKYLEHAIQSCLDQKYDNYEIIVGNNASEDTTDEVLSQIKSEKLKVVKSETSVSMSENFEKCIKKASGDYVVIIGDDDFLLPNSLPFLGNLILFQDKPDCIVQNDVFCRWADDKDELSKIEIHKFINTPSHNPLVKCSFDSYLKSKKNLAYIMLPEIYHGCVRRKCIDNISDLQKKDRLINASMPDVYLAIGLALSTQYFLVAPRPFSVKGSSSVSNGRNWANKKSIARSEMLRTKTQIFGEHSGSSFFSNLHEHYRIVLSSLGLGSNKLLYPSFLDSVYKEVKLAAYSEIWFEMLKDFFNYNFRLLGIGLTNRNLYLALDSILSMGIYISFFPFWRSRAFSKSLLLSLQTFRSNTNSSVSDTEIKNFTTLSPKFDVPISVETFSYLGFPDRVLLQKIEDRFPSTGVINAKDKL